MTLRVPYMPNSAIERDAETGSAERRRADREVFGETFKRSERQSDQSNHHLWRSRCRRDLSRENARQIAENVTGFFAVLAEWSNAERRAANDNKAPSKSHDRGGRHDR